jgi:hypothetical protein
MPYDIKKTGDKFCVVSRDTGKVHGCHSTRKDAIQQQRAIYVNAPPSKEKAKGKK